MATISAVGPKACGKGPPYAPPGWKWAVGVRAKTLNGGLVWSDTYWWPPGSTSYLASKKTIEQWLKEHLPKVDLTDLWRTYRWHIPAMSGEWHLQPAELCQ
jgi:hypothetical protein